MLLLPSPAIPSFLPRLSPSCLLSAMAVYARSKKIKELGGHWRARAPSIGARSPTRRTLGRRQCGRARRAEQRAAEHTEQ
jgi:hypothetical protein